jgi:L-gulono-1,4-lactone dehydrogenase
LTAIHNFGRNVEFHPAAVFAPRSEEEVLAILRDHRGRRIRTIGRLHSWSQVIVAEEVLLDLRHLNDVRVETSASGEAIATIGAGCQIKRVLAELDRQGGYTLPSVGLISEQTTAGAISTGTHGSCKHSLSYYVTAVRLAAFDPASGEPIVRAISTGTELQAARCALGCLGVILSVQVAVRRQYFVEEHLREYQSLDEVLAAEEEFPRQQFYLIPWRWTWLAQHRREVPGPRSLLAPLYRAYWFTFIDLGLHLVLLVLVRLLRSPALVRVFYRWLVMLTVIRGWRVVDRSQDQLIMEHELFRHVEIELFVTRSRLAEALEFVRTTICAFGGDAAGTLDESTVARGSYTHHYAICIRKVLPDEALVSMSSGHDESSYAISLISYARPSDRAGFSRFAEYLTREMVERFSARPHWGKVCPITSADADLLYPRLAEFREVCCRVDPRGLFRNDWTADVVFGGQAAMPRE